MKLFNRNPKFIYEVSGLAEEISFYDPYEMVRFIEEAADQFQRDYTKATITVTKIRNNLTSDVYYADRFELPRDVAVDWIEFLEPFFKNKPQSYSLENERFESERESTAPFSVEDFDKSFEESHKKATNVIKEETIVDEAVALEKSTDTLIQITKSELDLLKNAIKEQQIETERLKKQLSERNIVQETKPKEELHATSNVVSLDLFSNQTEKRIKKPVTEDSLSAVLSTAKKEMDRTLSTFLEQQTQKINSDIQQLDKRPLIELTVSQQIAEEEQLKLEQLETQLKQEKERQIQEENNRHIQTLETIDRSFSTHTEEKTKEITTFFMEKKESCIQKEYKKQTDELQSILEDKTKELQINQKTMHEGLKNNLQKTLDMIQQQHTQVFDEIERKRDRKFTYAEKR